MYFSRIKLRSDSGSCRELRTVMTKGEYGAHKMAWSFFDNDPSAKRDFIFRYERNNGATQLYVVSHREPVDKSGMWQIDTKEYDPKPPVGGLLDFSLRFNPTLDKKDSNGKRGRHDVVMDAKKNNREGDYIIGATEEWLHKREESCGFSLNGIRSATYVRRSFRGKGNNITFGVVDVSGFLSVTSAEAFKASLQNGIGRSKGFGMGLLLVRPV